MSSVQWKASAVSTVLSTELNSLAHAGIVASGEIDNTSDLNVWDDLELYISGTTSNTVINRAFVLYIAPALDGTNYADGGAGVLPPFAQYAGTFRCRAVTMSAQRLALRHVRIPPTKFKYILENQSGRTLSASGSTLKRVGYRESFVD